MDNVEAAVAYRWMAKGTEGGAKTLFQWRVEGGGPPLDAESIKRIENTIRYLKEVLAAQG